MCLGFGYVLIINSTCVLVAVTHNVFFVADCVRSLNLHIWDVFVIIDSI